MTFEPCYTQCTAFTVTLPLGDNKYIYNLKGFYKFNMR